MLKRLCVLILILGWGYPGSAQEDFNVDIFFGWGGCYRPMEWTPVEVGLVSFRAHPFAGTFHLSLAQDELNTMNLVHPLVLTPEVPLQVPLVAKLAFNADRCRLVLTNEEGRRQWDKDLNLFDVSTSALRSVHDFDLLIGVVGKRDFGLMQLEQKTICQTEGSLDRPEGTVYVRHKQIRQMPWDWTGYASLDALICYDPDWTQLRTEQWEALAQWVLKGGRVMIVLGRHPWPSDTPLTRCLPLNAGGLKSLSLTQSFLTSCALEASQTLETNIRSLQLTPDVSSFETRSVGEDIVTASGLVAFGRVTVIGIDPASLTTKISEDTASFWVYHLRELLANPLEGGVERVVNASDRRRHQPNGTPSLVGSMGIPLAVRTLQTIEDTAEEQDNRTSHFEITPAQRANNQVMEHLYNIEQMRPLSIGWVIGLLLLLALLIGPVDYWVLKRIDRQPWTWATCAGWIVLFTVGAYYGVQALRAGDLQLRIVTVHDAVSEQDRAWQTQYCGIFAPQSNDYPLLGLKPQQWWSGLSLSRDHLYRYGGQYGRRDITYLQTDGHNLPQSIPINIWTMQCLQNESVTERFPLNAEVRRRGSEITMTVTNLANYPLTRCALVFVGQQGFDLGTIAAGTSQSVTQSLRPLTTWWKTADNRNKLSLSDLFTAQGTLTRSQAMEAYLHQDAAVLIAERHSDAAAFHLTESDYITQHVEVFRLVVFPQ